MMKYKRRERILVTLKIRNNRKNVGKLLNFPNWDWAGVNICSTNVNSKYYSVSFSRSISHSDSYLE